MSHYRIAVFHHGDPEKLLEPFDENDEKYFIFEPVDTATLDKRWEQFKAQNPAWEFQQWLEEMYDYDAEIQSWGSRYNPNAKYDYYGEWYIEELFTVKPKAKAHDCGWFKKNQIDFDDHPFAKTPEVLGKEWDILSAEGDGIYTEKYYLEKYGTKEQYIKEQLRPPRPYAFVSPDGVWHAPGSVGWFATSDDTVETRERYWQEWLDMIHSKDDCFVTLYDCHI